MGGVLLAIFVAPEAIRRSCSASSCWSTSFRIKARGRRTRFRLGQAPLPQRHRQRGDVSVSPSSSPPPGISDAAENVFEKIICSWESAPLLADGRPSDHGFGYGGVALSIAVTRLADRSVFEMKPRSRARPRSAPRNSDSVYAEISRTPTPVFAAQPVGDVDAAFGPEVDVNEHAVGAQFADQARCIVSAVPTSTPRLRGRGRLSGSAPGSAVRACRSCKQRPRRRVPQRKQQEQGHEGHRDRKPASDGYVQHQQHPSGQGGREHGQPGA